MSSNETPPVDDTNDPAEDAEQLVVKRGPMQDSVEWSSGEQPPPSTPFRRQPDVHVDPPSPPPPRVVDEPVGMGQRPWSLIGMIAAILALGGLAIAFMPKPPVPIQRPLVSTFADLAPIHAGVKAGGEPVRVLGRVGIGSVVETDASGRARLRLDTGTTVIVDVSTSLTLTEKGVDLTKGRLFVVATSTTPVGVGEVKATVSGSSAAIERDGNASKIYSANGELTVRAGGADKTVHIGESAMIDGAKVDVVPERGFDDWTGGMAAPWAASGPPRRAMGEIWGRAQPGDPGSPLTIRACNVEASITGEVARTEVKTTFFNAGENNVLGDFRMAIPKGALVSRFATMRNGQTRESQIALASRNGSIPTDFGAIAARGDILEWAGDGWLRGTIPGIAPGETTTVVVSYIEWLSPTPKGKDAQVVEYRYPMVGEGAPPLIGEFFAHVDAGPSKPISLAAGMGARISGNGVEVRKPDFKPTADLVVDVEMPAPKSPVRAYVADPRSDDEDPTILVRTEAPANVAGAGNVPGGKSDVAGVTLALVLDTSTSIDPALLDAGKAFVESVVRGLGPNDRVIVFAADQGVRPVGPEDVGAVDAARKQAITDALAKVEQGGATDLGRSLELAAQRLPADAADGMVIYIGDGWPTLGDLTPEAIRARLARRDRGAPRIGAVAVGPSANRLVLAALTKDSGPLIEVADSQDASRASVELLESALVPTVTSVSLDLGPMVERVYPRSDLAVKLGSTVTFVGTLRGAPPSKITLTYRDAKGLHHEERAVEVLDTTYSEDIRRRWADLRVGSIALSGGGREATTDAALKAKLITPWTALMTNGVEYAPTALEARVLDTAVGPDLGFNAVFATPDRRLGTLAAPRDAAGFETDDFPIEGAMSLGAKRVLDEAKPSLRACRDSRAALRPELSGSVQIRFDLSGEGQASNVKVQGMSDNDDALNRCIATVVLGLEFPRSLTNDKAAVVYVANFPPPDKTLRARKCSPTSTLQLPLRRGVWRERIDRLSPPEAFLDAKRSCELPNWTAKRSMLELILVTLSPRAQSRSAVGMRTLEIATAIEDAGDAEAAAFLRKEALRRAAPEELRGLRTALLSTERVPVAALDKQYDAATDDKARLAVVQRFLAFAPHSTLLRTRQLDLLAALGDTPNLVAAVRLARLDPFADATLVAEGAHLLRKASPELESEARRTFFEIAERGPSDPWGRAFLGDKLRAEGWFDEATESYEVLERLVPGDGATGVRLALAHAGAKRLDVALRILSRIEKTGGRSADTKAATISDRLAHLVIADAIGSSDTSDDARARLVRREADFPALTPTPIVVVRTQGGAPPLMMSLERGSEKAREFVSPDAEFASVGVYTLGFPEGDSSDAVLSIAAPKGHAPAQPAIVEITIIRANNKPVTGLYTLKLSGDPVRLGWNGTALEAVGDRPKK